MSVSLITLDQICSSNVLKQHRQVPQHGYSRRPEYQDIFRGIVALAKSIKLEIIAEGIDTEQQRSFLIREGCNLLQGFLFSEGVTENDFLQLLSNNLVIAETSL